VDLLDANGPAHQDAFFGRFDCCWLGNLQWFAGCQVPHLKHSCLKLQPEHFSQGEISSRIQTERAA